MCVTDDTKHTRKAYQIQTSLQTCYIQKEHVDKCSLLKAQKAKVRKEVPRQANHGTRPLTQHHALLHGIKHQGIRLLNIKLLSLMHHDTRDLSISDLSRDLYLPITVANPRSNPSTLKGHRRWKMINTTKSHLFGCKAWWSG
jgi:hypothetical protein